jgi:hypothetical protein
MSKSSPGMMKTQNLKGLRRPFRFIFKGTMLSWRKFSGRDTLQGASVIADEGGVGYVRQI